jgi:hypothetical protein
MPVEFLSQDQQHRYGRYTEDPSPLQLARYFHFDDRDRQLIGHHRRDYSRLGFAIQLGTVRFLGTFLADPTDVPGNVVTNVADQLDIHDSRCLAQYGMHETHWDHTAEIKREYGYREFHDPPEVFRLVRWLYTRAWLSAERPSSPRQDILYLGGELIRPCLGNIRLTGTQSCTAPSQEPSMPASQRM